MFKVQPRFNVLNLCNIVNCINGDLEIIIIRLVNSFLALMIALFILKSIIK